eukprot:12734782-Alexandrium_andersonii.AAC.1
MMRRSSSGTRGACSAPWRSSTSTASSPTSAQLGRDDAGPLFSPGDLDAARAAVFQVAPITAAMTVQGHT